MKKSPINGAITKKVKGGMTQSKAIGQVYAGKTKLDKSSHASNKFHKALKKHVAAGKTPARAVALAHQGRSNGKKK